MIRHRFLVLAGLLATLSARAGAPVDLEASLARTPGLVDAGARIPALQVDLKYATADNFLGRPVYGDLDRCFLRVEAAEMLARADRHLRATRPDLRLRVYDCVRPHRVQVAMWNVVKGTPQQGYVANPHGKTGSIHNYGCAVDLTLARADGTPLDMGTPFDHFGPEAEPRREPALLAAGKLTPDQVANRLVLREAMVRAGFLPLDNEWWHFNCAPPAETRRRFPRVP